MSTVVYQNGKFVVGEENGTHQWVYQLVKILAFHIQITSYIKLKLAEKSPMTIFFL